jgi:hypothetical protein
LNFTRENPAVAVGLAQFALFTSDGRRSILVRIFGFVFTLEHPVLFPLAFWVNFLRAEKTNPKI